MHTKTALVTGGMGGIGTAICRNLLEQGNRVIATYNKGGNHHSAKEWEEQQVIDGYEFITVFIDVGNFKSCTDVTRQLAEEFGSIDILVNNAGITSDVQFYKMDLSQWQEVMHINLDSVFNVTRNVINLMLEHQYGRIINISSINGQKGQFGQTNYAAAKAGIHGFTKALALEVSGKGITVNTVSPGYIETPMVMAVPEDIREKIVAQIPVKRLGRPEEIARAVGFLASDDSGFITGSNLMINGGQYLA